jgi:sulfofructose kinase
MGFDVVGVGESSVQYTCLVPEFPEPDATVVMGGFDVQGGGAAATAMVTCARLGMRASLFAAVGDDGLGRFQQDALFGEGVDTGHLAVREGRQSVFSFVMVDQSTGTRTIVHNEGDLPELSEAELDRDTVHGAGCVLLDPYELDAAVKVGGWAREAGVPVVVDADAVVDGVSRLVAVADYLIGPVEFALGFANTRLIEKAVEYALSFGARVLILTMGRHGCRVIDRTRNFTVPAFNVDVVDTTGAGDVFHGACVVGIRKGWDLKRTAEFASAAAALSCTSLGPRQGIPRLAEVEHFLNRQRE